MEEDNEESAVCCPICNKNMDDGECEHLLACIADGDFLAGAADALWSYFREQCDKNGDSSDCLGTFLEACEAAADGSQRRYFDGTPGLVGHSDLFWARDSKDGVVQIAKILGIFDAN